MLIAREIEPAGGKSDIGARGKVQIFSALVENGVARIADRGGNLRDFRAVERINENRAQVALEKFRICEPLAVGRPGDSELHARIFEAIEIDFDGRALFD